MQAIWGDRMKSLLEHLNAILWGDGLLVLLVGIGLYCLCRGGWRPLLRMHHLFRKHAPSDGRGLSLWQASSASLAAAMGTGNIIGVAAALQLGGPGAIFWMWMAALLGMLLLYAENVLGCLYRRTLSDGRQVSGAIAYIRYGLGSPKLAWLFACFCCLAAFGMGNMTQSNAMAGTLEAAFGLPPLGTGLAAAVLTGAVILGGAKRIGRVTQCLMPAVSLLYLLLAGIVLWRCRDALPHAVQSIFTEAYRPSAAVGGGTGAALSHVISIGVRRGIFSNEAGLGSSSLLHGDADCHNPEQLGLLGMLEACIDTFLCCTVTALVLLCSGVPCRMDSNALILAAFRQGLGTAADCLLPPIIALFALATLIGWSYCGSTAFGYLTNGRFLAVYRILFCLAAVLGAVLELEVVWILADMANACMLYCHLPALLLLQDTVRRRTA